MFERLQDRLTDNTAINFRYATRQPFGNIARCASCGSRIDASLTDETWLYYVCNGKKCQKPQLRVLAENLEAAVIVGLTNVRKWLLSSLASGEWRTLIASRDEEEAAATELAAKEAEVEKLVRLAAKPGPAAEKAEAMLEVEDAALTDLRERHARLTQGADALEADLRRLLAALGTKNESDGFAILSLWDAADSVEQRRNLLEAILEKIDVERGAATLHFRYGIRDPYRISFDTKRRGAKDSISAELRVLGFGDTELRSIARASGRRGA